MTSTFESRAPGQFPRECEQLDGDRAGLWAVADVLRQSEQIRPVERKGTAMTMLSTTGIPELTPRERFDSDQRQVTLRYLHELIDDDAADAYADADDAADATAVHAAETRVSSVMVHGVVAAHEQARFADIVDALARNHVGAVPVLDETRHVVGVVSASDLLANEHHGNLLRQMTARELMSSPAVVARPGTSVDEAARLAARNRVHLLPVVDHDGVLVGAVTRADLLRVFLRPGPAKEV